MADSAGPIYQEELMDPSGRSGVPRAVAETGQQVERDRQHNRRQNGVTGQEQVQADFEERAYLADQD